jgi:hypothetical protein
LPLVQAQPSESHDLNDGRLSETVSSTVKVRSGSDQDQALAKCLRPRADIPKVSYRSRMLAEKFRIAPEQKLTRRQEADIA